MTVASPMFLLLTVLQTRRRKVPVWKSSALVALFTSVSSDDHLLEHLAGENFENVNRLSSTVKDVRVKVGDRSGLSRSGAQPGLWMLKRD
jgi:hypothetical protein